MSKEAIIQYDTEARLEVLPKGVLFRAFGGFANEKAKEVADKAVTALLNHIRQHNLVIDVAHIDGKFHLVFTKKTEGDVTDDL